MGIWSDNTPVSPELQQREVLSPPGFFWGERTLGNSQASVKGLESKRRKD